MSVSTLFAVSDSEKGFIFGTVNVPSRSHFWLRHVHLQQMVMYTNTTSKEITNNDMRTVISCHCLIQHS